MENYFKTWMFWLVLGVVLSLVGLLIHPMVSYVGIGILALIASIFILYAFIVNPINGLCNASKKVIYKGFHRPLLAIPFCLPRVINTYKKQKFFVDLKNTTTSELNHTNKLFGFSVGFGIHKNSFRTVYSEINKELFAYWYIDGKRNMESFKLNDNGETAVIACIERNKKGIIFSVDYNNSIKKIVVPFVSSKKYGLKLGFYYGGEVRADRKIKVGLFKL